MSLGLSASRSRLFLGASNPLLLLLSSPRRWLLSPPPRPWQSCGAVTMALEEVGGRPAPGAKMR